MSESASLRGQSDVVPTQPCNEARSVPVAWMAAFVLTLGASTWIAFASSFPGIYTPDSLKQLSQVLTGSYTDWHPPLMAWWWRMLYRATGAAWSLLAFHHLALAAGLSVLGVLLARNRCAWLMLPLALVPLSPVVVNFSGAMWKDVGCAVALSVTGATAAWPRRRGTSEIVRWAVVLGFGLYAVGVRWNALPAVLPIFVLAAWNGASPTRPLGLVRMAGIAGALTIACAVSLPAITYRVLRAQPEYIAGFMHAMDLAAILERTGDDRIPAFTRTAPDVTARQIAETSRYAENWGSAGFLFWPYEGHAPLLRVPRNDEEAAALGRAWREGVAAHPQAYLRHRVRYMEKLLRIGEAHPYFQYILPPGPIDFAKLASGDATQRRMGDLLVREHALAVPGAPLAKRITLAIIAPPAELPIFLGWPWLGSAAAITGAAVALRRRAPVLARASGAFAASAILFALSYLPVAPVSDFRFLYWTVLGTTLAAFLIVAAAWRSLRPA
jgi:hypothetical protein